MQAAMVEHSGLLAQFLPMMNQDFNFAPRATEETASAAYRVLIMESSASLAKLLATGLTAESLAVDVTHDVASAARLLESRAYNLMIMDMDPPDADGVNLLQTIRTTRPDLRVLVLSGRSGVEGLVAALDHGADDYLMKPFSLIELMARIRALRRRSDAPAQQAAAPKSSKIVLNHDQCRVQRDGKNIDLTPREFALLQYMMDNAGKTLSRAMLTQEVWNMPAEANTNIVDVYVKYLRDKLDGDHDEKLIRTVRGMGYLFQTQ
ncbi:response regulator transcription factor [Granulicella tundricola]|uniref:Two component transcriptional regulator, winged helix family n=1 Tax=Granulicella tundricola (strain ATCC BAA-1859 / DSM 23138 / MP5ACTX9) TaxID=1198114 RepID=E8X650_GRATM|nr:response regulator transcription factor [Granulicella tundricola]ADW70934.1 two component transcriptional regulator, winged helix family [Granulicella tundricola MP5ACTX9]